MDVLSNRKTVGRIEGDILLNGIKSTHPYLQGRIAYVQQVDTHHVFSTIRECLHFSAILRLPKTVTAVQRNEFVESTLHLLELDSIADRMVGGFGMPGLSPSQKKLVSIAVELVSNPSVIFLDEPTTGLDSRAALLVMRVIRKVAATGRTVLW